LIESYSSNTPSTHNLEARERAQAEEPAFTFSAWNTGDLYPVSSVPALSAAKCAGLQGKTFFEAYHMALYGAFFTDCRDISDDTVLISLAEETGLDIDRFHDDYCSGSTEKKVLADLEEYLSDYEGWGIPLVVINNNFPITGAVPAAVYRRAIDRSLKDTGK